MTHAPIDWIRSCALMLLLMIEVFSAFLSALTIPEVTWGADEEHQPPYLLEIRPSAEFAYEAGKSKLVGLKIGSESGPQINFTVPGDVPTVGLSNTAEERGSGGHQSQLLRLSGWIDIESRVTVRIPSLVMAPLTGSGWLRRRFTLLYAAKESSWLSSWR